MFANKAWHQLQCQLATRKEAGRKLRLEPTCAAAYQAMCGGLLTKEAVGGVQAVLDGTLSRYETTYVCTVNRVECTLRLVVMPLGLGCRGAVFSYQDLTAQRRREAKIYNLANLEPLTGLLNRRLFFVEANRVLDLAKRRQHPFALLYLDLDGFKAVNDTNGHEVGDDVLCQVARRLKGLLRESDLLARLGGDGFLILLPETDEQESLAAVKRYLKSLAQPLLVKDIPVTLKGSFGLAHYPSHGQTINDLVRLADGAMYQAKASGGGIRVHVSAQDDATKTAHIQFRQQTG